MPNNLFINFNYFKMKKILSFFSVLSLIFVAVSCDPTVTPEDPTSSQDSTVFVQAAAGYYGTDYTTAYNYYVQLATDMEVDTDGNFISAGEVVVLDLYSATEELTAGTYTLSSGTYAAGTFDSGYSLWAEVDSTAAVTTYGIASGTVVITKSGDNFTFKVNLVDSANNVRVGTYTGTLTVYDNTTSEDDPYTYEPTTPTTVDFTVPEGGVSIGNWGDYYGTGTDNLYVEMVSSTGDIVLELFAPTGTTELPVGVYDFAATGVAGTVLPGYLYESTSPIGSFAATATGDVFWLQSGSVTVAKSGDVYTITAATQSYYGSTVTITYTGSVAITDETSSSVAAKAAKKLVKKTAQPQKITMKARR